MFIGNTVLKRKNKNTYILEEDIIFKNEKYLIIVKKGFETNGASIPKICWSIIGCPFTGKYVGAAILHDALYASNFLTKHESDLLFLSIMEDCDVHVLKRNLMYRAVNIFGKSAWDEESIFKFNEKYIEIYKY